ncbi:hypothetical protein JZU69_04430, partial [bacterium]|nr:hypothetical protein [bacterium]
MKHSSPSSTPGTAKLPSVIHAVMPWFSALLLGSASQLAFASSEANLVLPNLNDVALASFVGGMSGW